MRMVRWGPRSGPLEFLVEIPYVSRNSASGVCLSKELLHPMMALQRNFLVPLLAAKCCPILLFGLSIGRPSWHMYPPALVGHMDYRSAEYQLHV